MVNRTRRQASIRRTATIAASLAAAIGLSLTGVSAASAADRTSYSGSVPRWATSANDVGAADATATFEGEVYLPLRNAKAATALATAVSSPGIGYRQGLSAADWIARFAPTQADSDAVVGYLTSQGFTISAVPASRQYVVFRGTAAQFGAAFGTSLHDYSYAGTTLAAPSSAPSLPIALGAKVSGVGIDQSRLLTHPDSVKQGDIPGDSGVQSFGRQTAAPSGAIATPCSSYIGQNIVTVPAAYNGQTQYSTYNCGYTPSQLRSAYGISALPRSQNGAGQTVAIIDAYASPSIVSDVNTYSSALGEPGLTAANYSQIVPDPSQFVDQEACAFPSGWQGEQTLDVEAVHGLATGAKILYVGGFNCGGGLDVALSKILDGKLANIVSNSYGDLGEAVPSDVLAGENNLYLQAAGEGVGLYFSSGDNGDEVANVGQPQPDFPASSPWVTAVGGTTLAIDQKGKISYETGWGDTVDKIVADPGTGALSYAEALPGSRFVGGAGGGVSTVFGQPWYQHGIVPNSLAHGQRVSPDIAALADPYTGFSIGISPIVDDTTLETGAFENETYGGTSLASPLTAAQIAIVQQLTHSTIGFANPTLYALDRVLPNAFRDVLPQNPRQAVAYTSKTSGNSYLVSFDTDTTLRTTAKYDDVTGIGGVSFSLLTLLGQGRH
ncbi:protease pro-enzyme activation domain-containing protein [Lysinimonas soli]|uniref:Protease pro-enzyme activation domain-containing protein n=1 Tax=Lysinimonas soli TaxID=1074233 RepID=A0ABW0NQL1_9MICO